MGVLPRGVANPFPSGAVVAAKAARALDREPERASAVHHVPDAALDRPVAPEHRAVSRVPLRASPGLSVLLRRDPEAGGARGHEGRPDLGEDLVLDPPRPGVEPHDPALRLDRDPDGVPVRGDARRAGPDRRREVPRTRRQVEADGTPAAARRGPRRSRPRPRPPRAGCSPRPPGRRPAAATDPESATAAAPVTASGRPPGRGARPPAPTAPRARPRRLPSRRRPRRPPTQRSSGARGQLVAGLLALTVGPPGSSPRATAAARSRARPHWGGGLRAPSPARGSRPRRSRAAADVLGGPRRLLVKVRPELGLVRARERTAAGP